MSGFPITDACFERYVCAQQFSDFSLSYVHSVRGLLWLVETTDADTTLGAS